MKIIRNENQLFNQQKMIKKTFSFLLFMSSFAITLTLLFRLSELNILSEWKKILVPMAFIALIWTTTISANKEIQISLKSRYISYIFATCLMIYLYIIIFGGQNQNFDSWWEYTHELVWYIPVAAIMFCWKTITCILEYKIRPFFAREHICSAIIAILFEISTFLSWWFIDRYKLGQNKQTFDYLSTENITLIILALIMGIAIIIIGFFAAKYRKFIKEEIVISKQTILISLFVNLFALFIWWVAQSKPIIDNWPIILYLVITILISIAIYYYVIKLNLSGDRSKIYNLINSSFLFINSIVLFLMIKLANINPVWASIPFLIGIISLYGLNIIMHPKILFLSRILLILLALFIGVYIIVLWLINHYLGDGGLNLIFSFGLKIDELILLIPLGISGLLFLFQTILLTNISIAISKHVKILYKKGIYE